MIFIYIYIHSWDYILVLVLASLSLDHCHARDGKDLKRIEDMEAALETNRKHLVNPPSSGFNIASLWLTLPYLQHRIEAIIVLRGSEEAKAWRNWEMPMFILSPASPSLKVAPQTQSFYRSTAPIVCRWITWTTCVWSPTCRKPRGRVLDWLRWLMSRLHPWYAAISMNLL